MITRPLDLASRLRPEPRNFDTLFYANGGMIVLFFLLFGSKFVLAPALGVDFRLPQIPHAALDARPTTHHVSVTNSEQILVSDGVLTMDLLIKWLRKEAKTVKEPVLLLQADERVPMSVVTKIGRAAEDAGFSVRCSVEEPKTDIRRESP